MKNDSDSDCLIIDENEEIKKPKIEKLLIKKNSNGNYTIENKEKVTENKEFSINNKKLIKPSNQTMFYMVPVFKRKNLKREEISKMYKKNIVENSNFNLQKNIVSNFLNQDPSIDSTNSQQLEECSTIVLNSDSENEDKFLRQESIFNDSQQESNDFEKLDTPCNSGIIDSSTLDPIILSRSLGGGYCIKKDCFFGEKSCNPTEFEGLLSRHSSLEKRITYTDMQIEEPILETLFSSLSDDISNSQATTLSALSQDCDFKEINEDSFQNSFETTFEKEENLVDNDGSLRVITKSDSNVFIAGYD